MRECRTYGSVRGAPSNGRPYRDLAPRFEAPKTDVCPGGLATTDAQ